MRSRRPGFSEPELVTSNKSTTNGFFHALSTTMDAVDVGWACTCAEREDCRAGLVCVENGPHLAGFGYTCSIPCRADSDCPANVISEDCGTIGVCAADGYWYEPTPYNAQGCLDDSG